MVPSGCKGFYGATRSNRGLQEVIRSLKVTGGYEGQQGDPRSYRGVQRGYRVVAAGYRLFQGVTEGYKGLQGVTRGCKGLQGGCKTL